MNARLHGSAFMVVCLVSSFVPLTARAEGTSSTQEAHIAPSAPPESAPTLMRPANRGMKYTGIALTIVGGLSLTAGTVVIVGDLNDGGGVNIAAIVVGIPLAVGGFVFSAVGLPLWLVGGREVPRATAASSRFIPQIGIGPRAATLRWSF